MPALHRAGIDISACFLCNIACKEWRNFLSAIFRQPATLLPSAKLLRGFRSRANHVGLHRSCEAHGLRSLWRQPQEPDCVPGAPLRRAYGRMRALTGDLPHRFTRCAAGRPRSQSGARRAARGRQGRLGHLWVRPAHAGRRPRLSDEATLTARAPS